MANYVYGGTLTAFETAKSSDVAAEFQKVQTMSATEETRTDDAIKFPDGEGNDIRITETAGQRAKKVLAFDVNGDLELQTGLEEAQTSTSADAISTAADVVSTNADASTCVTKAGEASSSASIANTDAGTATTKANEASTSASDAASSAGELQGYDVIGTTGTIALDFNGNQTQYIAAAGAITFGASSNKAAGKSITVIFFASGGARTIAYNGSWHELGILPTSIVSGKYYMMSLVCNGAAETDILVSGVKEL